MANRKIKNKRRKKKKSNSKEETGDIDRLSSLPDKILINILSHLPNKSAIATTSLSRRWSGLWTQIDSLEFNINHFKNCSFMFPIINQVLTQITHIRKFTLHFSCRCFCGIEKPYCGEAYLESCFHQLCVRNIEQIQFKVGPFSRISRMPNKLPHCVFQTPSLMVLEFDSLFCNELPTYDDDNDERVHVPNLNKLRIFFPDKSYKAFSKLIRSCPSLEDLSFSISGSDYPENEHVYLDISSQSLKILDMDLPSCLTEKPNLIVINAPKLLNLNVGSTLYRIRGLEPLVALLESFPVLEVLTLSLLVCRKETIFTPPASSLACVSTHLKRIEMSINETISYENLLRVVECLLSISRVMEQLLINITDPFNYKIDKFESNEEKRLCEHLYKLPTSLLFGCEIVFSGIYFEAWVPNGSIVMLSCWEERLQD